MHKTILEWTSKKWKMRTLILHDASIDTEYDWNLMSLCHISRTIFPKKKIWTIPCHIQPVHTCIIDVFYLPVIFDGSFNEGSVLISYFSSHCRECSFISDIFTVDAPIQIHSLVCMSNSGNETG